MSDEKHSPGKIAVERGVIAGDIVHLALTARNNGSEWMVASVTPMKWLRPIDEANAVRLAHCWNTHDALVEALKAIRDANDPDKPESYRCDDREGCLDFSHTTASKALMGEPL